MDWRSHPYIPPNDHLFWFLHKVGYRKAETGEVVVDATSPEEFNRRLREVIRLDQRSIGRY